MVRHQPGHKNSKGEKAEWVIVSHETGKIISSHKTKADAEKHLKDIRKFKHMGESMELEQAKKILSESGYAYVDVDKELKRKKRFAEDLERYKECMRDFYTALRTTKEGLSGVMTEDMETYVVDETRFLLKMAKRLVKFLETDLHRTIDED